MGRLHGDYRYGFNGKETDPESDLQDYGFRIYNARLGKFLSVDPLTSEYPWNSTYAFAENGPIENIDLDGCERYSIHQRAFAPWVTFGHFNSIPSSPYYHGDNRNFSLSDNVTSRVSSKMMFEISTGKEILSKRNSFCDWSYSYDQNNNKTGAAKAIPTFWISGPRKDGNNVRFKSYLTGGNPLVPLSYYVAPIQWDSDINISNHVNEGYIDVFMTTTGRGFPAFESFIEDSKGTRVFLATFRPNNKDEFFTRLATVPIAVAFSFKIRIHTDCDGNFTGALSYNNKQLTIETWNEFKLSLPASLKDKQPTFPAPQYLMPSHSSTQSLTKKLNPPYK